MRKLQIDIEHKKQELELEFINAKLDEDLQIQTKIACSASGEIKHLKSNYTIASEHDYKLEEECSELKLKLEYVDRKSNKKRKHIKKLTKKKVRRMEDILSAASKRRFVKEKNEENAREFKLMNKLRTPLGYKSKQTIYSRSC